MLSNLRWVTVLFLFVSLIQTTLLLGNRGLEMVIYFYLKHNLKIYYVTELLIMPLLLYDIEI